MLKITDKDYKLPQIHALEGYEVLDTGTTKPMMIKGVDMSNGTRGHYVVKYINANRMDIRSTCREVLGLWIGMELGLNMVEPVAVSITQEFVNNLKGKDGFLSAQNSIGLNFGSRYVEGYNELLKGQPLTDAQTNEVKDIFAFDMFISNADRGAGKPNVLTNGKQFLLFDHELAFSFVLLLPFLQNKTPWLFGDGEREMYEKHYFYNYLKKTNIDFGDFTNRFTCINDSFWESVHNLLPKEWHNQDLETIQKYLKAITENKEIFAEQLVKIISL